MRSRSRLKRTRFGKRLFPNGERHAQIPKRVLEDAEYQLLPLSAKHVLTCLAAEYMGKNNGALTFTREDGKRYGITHARTRSNALNSLERSGFIVKTYQGGKKPRGPTRWALAWQPVDMRDGEASDENAPECRSGFVYKYYPCTPRSTAKVSRKRARRVPNDQIDGAPTSTAMALPSISRAEARGLGERVNEASSLGPRLSVANA